MLSAADILHHLSTGPKSMTDLCQLCQSTAAEVLRIIHKYWWEIEAVADDVGWLYKIREVYYVPFDKWDQTQLDWFSGFRANKDIVLRGD